MMRVDTKKPSAVTRSETPPEEGPPTRQTKVRDLHMLMQRFVVAEGSCKNIENRITLLLSSIELLRSIPRKGDQWWERKNHDSQYTQENPSMGRKHPDWGCGITPSTLDRDQRMLEALQLSCQHSEQWSQAYSKRANIQVQLVSACYFSPVIQHLRIGRGLTNTCTSTSTPSPLTSPWKLKKTAQL